MCQRATFPALNEKLDKLKLLCSLSQQKSTKPQTKEPFLQPLWSLFRFTSQGLQEIRHPTARGSSSLLVNHAQPQIRHPTTRGSSSPLVNYAQPPKKPGSFAPPSLSGSGREFSQLPQLLLCITCQPRISGFCPPSLLLVRIIYLFSERLHPTLSL